MGHFAGIDSLAYQSRALHWPPLGKLLLSICLLIGSLSSKSPYGPLLVLGVGLFLFLYSTGGKMPSFIIFLIGSVMAFSLAGVFIIALTQAGQPILGIAVAGATIGVTREGLSLAALVFLRTFAGLFVMLFFAASTPIPHIFNSLNSVGLPDYIAEITILIYRYSFMMLEQSWQMLNAAGCRMGFSGWRNSMRTMGMVAANMFIRSLEFAERSQYALQSRNFGGRFPLFQKPAEMTPAWGIISIVALAGVYLVGNA
ncbi:cobalt ECF transporter T component CbiQ [Methanocella conradii]|uniref:cobalt ECF transporter T component CbiQ n=1 Tax=Methanocella conradii TaxID=1175444 RepID=UPI00157C279A|nr:cobalt ECF transporter T component CbiQ [Methanocella conradii]